MPTGPVFDQGGIPRMSLKGNVALRLDTGDLEVWNTVSLTWSTAAGPGWVVPTGGVIAYAGMVTTLPAAPAGYLLCAGQAVSRTTYARLFAVIGVTYGVGDGLTTFNVPNLVQNFIEGAANDGTLGAAGGAVAPGMLDLGHVHGMPAAIAVGAGAIAHVVPGNTAAAFSGVTVPDGRPPYLDLHWLIKD